MSERVTSLKHGVLITTGEWAGWRAIGPYRQTPRDGPPTQYYRLTRAGVQKHVAASKLQDILGLGTITPSNEKPFLS